MDSNGNISTRRWYVSNGNAYRDVDMTNHGNFATHPDFPEAVYPSDKGLVLSGVEKKDLNMMLKNYGKPDGYTWHHLEDGKGMLLVETKIHSGFHHSGGASVLRNSK